jgi:hypothetical protein
MATLARIAKLKCLALATHHHVKMVIAQAITQAIIIVVAKMAIQEEIVTK